MGWKQRGRKTGPSGSFAVPWLWEEKDRGWQPPDSGDNEDLPFCSYPLPTDHWRLVFLLTSKSCLSKKIDIISACIQSSGTIWNEIFSFQPPRGKWGLEMVCNGPKTPFLIYERQVSCSASIQRNTTLRDRCWILNSYESRMPYGFPQPIRNRGRWFLQPPTESGEWRSA